MPDARTAVLITRPQPGAAATAARVAALGLEPVVSPVLAIEALAADLPDPAVVGAVLATSGSAVSALSPHWRGVPLFAVGDATSRKAEAAGFADVRSAAGDAAALAALVARVHPIDGRPLLLASGEGQGEALAAELRGRGFAVIRREVYAARAVDALPEPARQALAGGRVRAGLFFSAETARVFVALVLAADLASCAADVEALAIGHPAAVALEALPWRAIRVAARPTQDEMLALLR